MSLFVLIVRVFYIALSFYLPLYKGDAPLEFLVNFITKLLMSWLICNFFLSSFFRKRERFREVECNIRS